MKPLPLSPDLLAHIYDYLTCLPPFDKLNMPPSDDIKFRVMKSKRIFARYIMDGGTHRIDFSSGLVGSHAVIISTMSHEMIHLHLAEIDACDQHGPAFQELAEKVCTIHGFDRLTF
jgi:hypothetical protein